MATNIEQIDILKQLSALCEGCRPYKVCTRTGTGKMQIDISAALEEIQTSIIKITEPGIRHSVPRIFCYGSGSDYLQYYELTLQTEDGGVIACGMIPEKNSPLANATPWYIKVNDKVCSNILVIKTIWDLMTNRYLGNVH